MRPRNILLPLLLSSSIFLTSCSQPSVKSLAAPSYTAINGNWHIAGQPGNLPLPPVQSPLLTFAMGVNGNTLYAMGNVGVTCAGGRAAVGGGMPLIGQIATDGTFTLSNSDEPSDTIQITIQGEVPADGATTWTGNYTVVNAASQTGCLFDDSGSFVATLYPPLNGTYTGTLTGPHLGAGWGVTVQMSQGAFTSATIGASSNPIYFTPVSSTISISGSSTLTAGTTAANPISSSSAITGNAFIVNYVMNDGSILALAGWFTDPSETNLQVSLISFTNPTLSSNISTLTRQ